MKKNKILLVVFILALFFLPFIFSRSWISIFTEILIMSLAGCALNILIGYTGMVSFGPAGLYASGAYTTAILLSRYGYPFASAFIASPIVSAILGLVVGWFCVRRTAVYFALLTLAFSQIIWTIIFEWYDFTNGDNGIVSIPIPEFLFSSTISYYFVLIVVLLCILIIWKILNSPFGKTLQAIRENPLRTEFIGVNVRIYQLAAFILSSFFLGTSGSLYCIFSGSAFPDYAHWAKSTDMIVTCLLGGINSFAGPIVGSAIYVTLSKIISKYTTYWLFYLGIIILIVVLYLPNGIAGFLKNKISNWNKTKVTGDEDNGNDIRDQFIN